MAKTPSKIVFGLFGKPKSIPDNNTLIVGPAGYAIGSRYLYLLSPS